MNNQKWLPSKQFQIRAGAVAGLLVVIFFWVWAVTDKQTAEIDLAALRESEIDSDKDGLKDWEEALWQTNPDKKDTDGDGSDDGSEVLAKRDPLIPGPNDDINSDQIIALYNYRSSDSRFTARAYNQTQNMANVLIPQSVILTQKKNLTMSDIDTVIGPFENSVVTATSVKNQFTTDDIQTVETNNATKAEYASKMEEIFIEYGKVDNDEIAEFAKYLENNNEAGVIGMRSSAMRYESLANKLIAIDVPSVSVAYHLKLTNQLGTLSGSLERLSEYYNDPVDAMIGLKQFKEVSAKLPETIANIAKSITT